jgi:HEAT repeat protein
VPSLVGDLKTLNLATRHSATRALGEIGAAAQSAVPALMQELDDTRKPLRFRESCALALGNIGPPAKAAIPALIRALGESGFLTHPLRAYAAEALGKIVVNEKEAIEALRQATRDEYEIVRRNATRALKRLQE